MNIEESINLLEWANLNKLYIETYNECDYHNIYKSIETLLTAYEKEKEKTEYEKELRIKYQKRYDSVKEKLEKEKEKNKELEDTLKQTQNSWYEDTKVIEKQSKEIEELKITKKELTERVLRLESDKFWDNVVSKDKIKAKIEECKNEKKERK